MEPKVPWWFIAAQTPAIIGDRENRARTKGSIMPQFETEPLKCRLDKMSADGRSGASCHEFCLYELSGCPGCPGCPGADRERPISHLAEDPMKSAVLRGWIRGLAHISN